MSFGDGVGTRGEWICQLELTAFYNDKQLFRVAFLGDKWPAVDLMVEAIEPTPGGRRGFFFAQVKTTRQGYQSNGRLRVPATPRDKLEALRAYAVPTYILGVDEPNRRVYLVAAQGRVAGMSSLSVAYELTRERLAELHEEVDAYWGGLSTGTWTSRFQEPNWRQSP